MDNNWSTYPSVAKTASINGFADRIYDQLPECAKPCMFQNTGVTPCPYWDTGCLCIMPTFQGAVGTCIAENCRGEDVLDARSLATSICSSAGVWDPYWMPPASVTTALSTAAAAEAAETTPASTEEEKSSSAPAETSAPETTAQETSAPADSSAPAETSAPETTAQESSAAESSAPAESSAAGSEEEKPSSAEEQTSSSAPAEGEGEGETSSEASVATVNGAVIPGVAMGGVIAALAALI
ncbi:Pga7 protein [Candida orthopsilosis Co 90-125]|uniref:Pga7 protein n=1 Tax=Candida orthopsilosis (strain 90-125) TaxID=1136231 RepID=H8X7U7_CANO9|nr:Pga7 protein [Candida orthopsilosis Co 90-125]CCG23883.1 Pga7 protein [Candida orthopsilosis Co 90-125]